MSISYNYAIVYAQILHAKCKKMRLLGVFQQAELFSEMMEREIALMNSDSLFGLLAVLGLVAANGFFVAGEFALVKVRSTRIEQLVNEGNKTASVVQTQLRHLDTSIAATQLGITLASLALGWIGEPSLAHLIDIPLVWIAGSTAETVANSIAIVISFLLITALHIILGELVPKSIALQRSEGTALFVSRPLLLFSRIFHPFILVMNGLGNLVVRALGMQSANEETSVHSVEELEMLVVQSRQAGILDQHEEVLLRRVFDFEEKMAQHIMVTRTEVVGVPITVSFEQLQAILTYEGYTRLPVYEGTIDSIVGFIHIKDVFALMHPASSHKHSFDIHHLLRPVLAVPETTSLATMLTQMRATQKHFAVVIDEYGATVGIVTLEDIVEEIVGEIDDEFDTREADIQAEVEVQADGSSLVDGLMSIQAFAERFGVQVRAEYAHTVGGYLLEQLDRLPVGGESVPVGSLHLRVEEMDCMRIARLRVLPTRSSESIPHGETPSCANER